jgi:hypothetical protein
LTDGRCHQLVVHAEDLGVARVIGLVDVAVDLNETAVAENIAYLVGGGGLSSARLADEEYGDGLFLW